MINKDLNDDFESYVGKTREIKPNLKRQAQDYVKKFIMSVNAVFDINFNYDEYADGLYQLLNYENYRDEDIMYGKCDKALYRYIANGELNPRFSEIYIQRFYDAFSKTNKIFDTEIRSCQKSDDTGSMYYGYYANTGDRRPIACEALLEASKLGVSDKDFDHFLVDYINRDRMRACSINARESRRAQYEESQKKMPISAEAKAKFIIAILIFFGITAVSTACYEYRLKKEEEKNKNNKPTHSYRVQGTSSHPADYYEMYDFDSNEFVIGGENIERI